MEIKTVSILQLIDYSLVCQEYWSLSLFNLLFTNLMVEAAGIEPAYPIDISHFTCYSITKVKPTFFIR